MKRPTKRLCKQCGAPIIGRRSNARTCSQGCTTKWNNAQTYAREHASGLDLVRAAKYRAKNASGIRAYHKRRRSLMSESDYAAERERKKNWLQKNPGRAKEYQKRYRDANREKELERMRRYREANRESICERARLRYRENRVDELARRKTARVKNPERHREIGRMYREKNREKDRQRVKTYQIKNRVLLRNKRMVQWAQDIKQNRLRSKVAARKWRAENPDRARELDRAKRYRKKTAYALAEAQTVSK